MIGISNTCKQIMFALQHETRCAWDDPILLKQAYTAQEVGRIESRQ